MAKSDIRHVGGNFLIWFSIKLRGDYRTDGWLRIAAKSKKQAREFAILMLDPFRERELLLLSVVKTEESFN